MYILGINAYHGNASAGNHCGWTPDRRRRGRAIQPCEVRSGFSGGGHSLLPGHSRHHAPRKVRPAFLSRAIPGARLGTKLLYALRMPSFARERAKVMTQFVGNSREALAKAFDVSPDSIRAKFHRVEHPSGRIWPAPTFSFHPFDQAALLSADGLGDFASTMWGSGRGNHMQIDGAIAFPHSLGRSITRPCLNTWDSANSATNTKSWASRRTASLPIWTSSAELFSAREAWVFDWACNISNTTALALK